MMRYWLAIWFGIGCCSIQAQDGNRTSLFDTLHALGDIHIRLVYPFDSLYKSRQDDIEAVVDIRAGSQMLLENEEMKLNLRGKFRRMKCTSMPPLMLNFKKGMLRDMGLTETDDIKLVTHCIDGEEGIQNLEEEFLCYQLYASLTPYAYRVAWVRVKYCSATSPDSCIESQGFLLEPDKDLAKRLDLEERKRYNIAEDSLDRSAYGQMTTFNFLVGNRDWSVVANRNCKLFYNPATQRYIPIPYDFDFANIVGATYRRETFVEGIQHPFDRIYQGEYFEPHSGQFLKDLLSHEVNLVAILEDETNRIDRHRRKKISRYFDQLFRSIEKNEAGEMRFGMISPYKGNL